MNRLGFEEGAAALSDSYNIDLFEMPTTRMPGNTSWTVHNLIAYQNDPTTNEHTMPDGSLGPH